ncbi:HdeD family acid-resistance protein [Candidatus Solirubrobacter pratensis]|uniref:HdeD family acid-resistance protein n=1 Tax=Candidatus Solirubrobacter pratensis TaxID=1298857 RepID=UPI000487A731|nr:DUF308 domain-containing protein [Candidatus Solirubrobacter pratensis]
MQQSTTVSVLREAVDDLSRWWWLWLVAGIAWIVIALAVLQFDRASVTTVGVLIGLMFLLAAAQQFALAALAPRLKWLWALFGALFIVAGVVSLISPENTFAGVADILGFLFLLVATFWIIQSFAERPINDFWWLGLTAGILMVVLAFWTSGQFFITKVYVLLVFAGIWALMQGVTDIVRAFQIRGLRSTPEPTPPRQVPAHGPAGTPA